ncbi:MAG: 16S rRNA (guanine(527)-N(7))-methyltransferase RsmG [Ignavibacteria bacterium]|nr:16S rRNA (guanine(527)-N(7))-methyltransferase RsmG [Ignavibacteria bacterium]
MELLKRFIEIELKKDSFLFINEFILFEKLLLEWNEKINLISRKSVSAEDHIINSIFFLTKYSFDKVKSVADIGSGGGFPGIPVKILFPEIRITLIDSIRKKVNVQQDITEKMNLKKIEALCGRAEELSVQTKYKSKYDIVISKAVSSLDNLYLWGNKFLNSNGEMICIKGGNIEEEISSLLKLKKNLSVEVISFEDLLPYSVEDKKIVVIKNKF